VRRVDKSTSEPKVPGKTTLLMAQLWHIISQKSFSYRHLLRQKNKNKKKIINAALKQQQ